jgi:hypothetical protein
MHVQQLYITLLFFYKNDGTRQCTKRKQWIENMVYEEKTMATKVNFNCEYHTKACS